MLWRSLQPILWMLAILVAAAPAAMANHTLRQSVFDQLGPLAWGLYVILPMPFIIIGTIAFLLYRAARRNAEHDPKPY